MRDPDPIDNSADIIDSRDIIARIEHLEERLDEDHVFEEGEIEPLDDDEKKELAALKKVADECDRYGDWEDGAALIRDSHFADHAEREFVETADHNVDMSRWPYSCIDWEKAAEELQQDYMSVEFDGVTYWMRA